MTFRLKLLDALSETGCGGAPAGMGRGGPQGPPNEAKEVLLENFSEKEADYVRAHMWNWLDGIKSGEKPIADVAKAFNGHLACLMAVESIWTGRGFRWDSKAPTARPA